MDAFVEESCKPYYVPRARRRCRGAAISACAWSVMPRASTASGALYGAVRIPTRCGIFCGLRTGTRFPTIPGCRKPEAACRMKRTRKSLAGFERGRDVGRLHETIARASRARPSAAPSSPGPAGRRDSEPPALQQPDAQRSDFQLRPEGAHLGRRGGPNCPASPRSDGDRRRSPSAHKVG